MRKLILLSLFICGYCIPAFSQTNGEKLEEAIKIYNVLYAYVIGLDAPVAKDIDRIKTDLAEAEPLLVDVKENGTADEAVVARYFLASFRYELGYAYAIMGNNAEAYRWFALIKSDFEFFGNPQNYPLRYKFDSKTYQITFENFSGMLSEYYSCIAEVTSNLKKYDECIAWCHMSLEFSGSDTWSKYIVVKRLMSSKEANYEWDKEMMDCALLHIQFYTQLDTYYIRMIKEKKYPTPEYDVKKIKTAIEKVPSLAKGEYHRGTAAPLLVKAKMNSAALEFYLAALEGGFAENDKSYLFDAATFSISEQKYTTALLALDILYDKNATSLACYEWEKLSELYGQAGNSEKKNNCSAKANACRKKDKKEAKRNESGRVGFGVYVGVYPLALATRYDRYRDYGGVVGIMLGKIAIEGSYKLINRNFVVTDDLYFKQVEQGFPYYWEGYRMHAALKFYSEKNSRSDGFHVGPLFEIVERTYEPIWSDVSNKSTGIMVAQDKKFYAREKSYNLFFNSGVQKYTKGLYFDAFIGFGVSYSKFDAREEYNDGEHTFSDILLENRKDTRFGVMMRTGIIIGFGLIKR